MLRFLLVSVLIALFPMPLVRAENHLWPLDSVDMSELTLHGVANTAPGLIRIGSATSNR